MDFNNKPPAFPLSQPSNADQVGYNWSFNSTNSASAIMLFGNPSTLHNIATSPPPVPSTSTSGFGFFKRQPRVKRKSESDDYSVPTKHFVSEQKMIDHLNGLHLSDNFQSHNIIPDQTDPVEEADMEASCTVNLSPIELEQRLKKANRISFCDQIRKNLRDEDEIIPKVLLDRVGSPCRALMIWQPKPQIEQLISCFDNRLSDEEDEEDNMDNNNNNDPNNNMDMDV